MPLYNEIDRTEQYSFGLDHFMSNTPSSLLETKLESNGATKADLIPMCVTHH